MANPCNHAFDRSLWRDQEPWLHRKVYIAVENRYGDPTRPGIIVACWPGERMPVARVRVLCDARLYDVDAINVEFEDGKLVSEAIP